MKNGQGTFAVVLKNIIEVVKEGIVVTLRINIDEENANKTSDEKRMGFIGKNGTVCVERSADLYKLQTVTARDNPECRQCIELPYCIASCKYERAKNNTKCLGKSGDGLSLREKALLDYYSDLRKKQGGISNE